MLIEKIKQKKAIIGVVGIGYVGRPLAEAANSVGFEVIGFSRGREKVVKLNNLKKKKLSATNDFSKLSKCDIVCVCVPTPIYEDKRPDLTPLESALSKISIYLKKGQMIIIESSIAPGTTRNFALPILKKSGYRIGKDFFLAFSPERIDPGNKKFNIKNTSKIVAGLDQKTTEMAVLFLENFIENVVSVSSPETAEMTKILENTYRLVNISLMNELMDYMKSLGIDIWEVIFAAKTKPFGFMAHYPGPGIGGHCIPVDPYYLLDDAKKRGIPLNIIKQAGKVNDYQPFKVIKQGFEILRKQEEINAKAEKENQIHKILLVGITYKADVADIRESPAIKIWQAFEKQKIEVSYHDPYILNYNGQLSKDLHQEILKKYDLIVIITNHNKINYQKLIESNKPILDTRNVFKNISSPNIYSL